MTHQQASPSFMRLKVFFSSMLLLGLTQGCVNLKAVQDFANISAESAEYTSLVDNYLDFPQRQKRYQPDNQHALLDAMAQERMTQKTELLLSYEIIQEYMEALGELAADGIVDQTKEFSQLTTALQTQAGTSPGETEAASKIAGFLTRAITEGWRQKQIQELIKQTNGSLQDHLTMLIGIVKGYELSETIELDNIKRYYKTKIFESKDPAGIAALKEWQKLREGASADRTHTIQTYASLLQKIGEGHQKLYDNRKDLDKAQIVKQIKQSVKELKDLLKTIKKI